MGASNSTEAAKAIEVASSSEGQTSSATPDFPSLELSSVKATSMLQAYKHCTEGWPREKASDMIAADKALHELQSMTHDCPTRLGCLLVVWSSNPSCSRKRHHIQKLSQCTSLNGALQLRSLRWQYRSLDQQRSLGPQRFIQFLFIQQELLFPRELPLESTHSRYCHPEHDFSI